MCEVTKQIEERRDLARIVIEIRRAVKEALAALKHQEPKEGEHGTANVRHA